MFHHTNVADVDAKLRDSLQAEAAAQAEARQWRAQAEEWRQKYEQQARQKDQSQQGQATRLPSRLSTVNTSAPRTQVGGTWPHAVSGTEFEPCDGLVSNADDTDALQTVQTACEKPDQIMALDRCHVIACPNLNNYTTSLMCKGAVTSYRNTSTIRVLAPVANRWQRACRANALQSGRVRCLGFQGAAGTQRCARSPCDQTPPAPCDRCSWRGWRRVSSSRWRGRRRWGPWLPCSWRAPSCRRVLRPWSQHCFLRRQIAPADVHGCVWLPALCVSAE